MQINTIVGLYPSSSLGSYGKESDQVFRKPQEIKSDYSVSRLQGCLIPGTESLQVSLEISPSSRNHQRHYQAAIGSSLKITRDLVTSWLTVYLLCFAICLKDSYNT